MKKVKLLDTEVKVHNNREAALVRIIQQKVARVVRYYHENTFGDDTYRILAREAREISEDIAVLYYLDCIAESQHYFADDIIKIMENGAA